MTTFGAVNTTTTLLREVTMSIEEFTVSGSPSPTIQTIGSTPTVHVYHFDNTNEQLQATWLLPENFDGTKDVTLHLLWSLVNSQTNGDTLDVTIDYVATTIVSGTGFDKTSTQLTTSIIAVTGRLAAEDLYDMTATIANGDATNPLTAANSIAFEFHLTNTTDVSEAHFAGSKLVYEANH